MADKLEMKVGVSEVFFGWRYHVTSQFETIPRSHGFMYLILHKSSKGFYTPRYSDSAMKGDMGLRVLKLSELVISRAGCIASPTRWQATSTGGSNASLRGRASKPHSESLVTKTIRPLIIAEERGKYLYIKLLHWTWLWQVELLLWPISTRLNNCHAFGQL